MASIDAFNKSRTVILMIFAVAISFLSSFIVLVDSYVVNFVVIEFIILTCTCVYNTMSVSDGPPIEQPSWLGLVLQSVRYLKPSLAVPAEVILLIVRTFGRVLMDLCVFLFSIFVCAAVMTLF